MINKHQNLEKFNYPFPYIKINNFLSEDFFENLEKNFPKINEFQNNDRSVNRMDHDTTHGDNLYSDLLNRNSFYKKFHQYIYSEQFVNYFIDLFKDDILKELKKGFLTENILTYHIKPEPFEVGRIIGKKEFKKNNNKFFYPRLDIGLGLEGYGKNSGGGGIHIDNPQRLISMLFYLGGYNKIEGGDHRVWKKSSDKNILEIHENIKPERNLLIAALQNNLAFHDVNPIKYIEGSRNAFYLAISSSIPIWKSVKGDNFNLKYNKNRVKLGLIQKIKKKFLKQNYF